MKKITFLIFVLTSLSAISQPSIKIFAYSQAVSPGIVPKGVTDENGKTITTKKEIAVNYYIFASYNKSIKINIEEIWIKGNFFNPVVKNIDSTPVLNINETIPGNPVKVIMVPATTQKVISLKPGELIKNHIIQASSFRNLAKHAELIISYVYKGKKYFIGVKKIKVLEPIAGV
jgi:hypothetical protein